MDLLVRLYDIPDEYPEIEKMKKLGITIRKPIGPENYSVISWINETFGPAWAGEAENAFFNNPKTIVIAERNAEILGFACVDATAKGFFGPTGVAKEERGKGIGKALLITALNILKDLGYGYAAIGSPGPVDFYKEVCGAIEIPDSSPGIYKDMIWPKTDKLEKEKIRKQVRKVLAQIEKEKNKEE